MKYDSYRSMLSEVHKPLRLYLTSYYLFYNRKSILNIKASTNVLESKSKDSTTVWYFTFIKT